MKFRLVENASYNDMDPYIDFIYEVEYLLNSNGYGTDLSYEDDEIIILTVFHGGENNLRSLAVGMFKCNDEKYIIDIMGDGDSSDYNSVSGYPEDYIDTPPNWKINYGAANRGFETDLEKTTPKQVAQIVNDIFKAMMNKVDIYQLMIHNKLNPRDNQNAVLVENNIESFLHSMDKHVYLISFTDYVSGNEYSQITWIFEKIDDNQFNVEKAKSNYDGVHSYSIGADIEYPEQIMNLSQVANQIRTTKPYKLIYSRRNSATTDAKYLIDLDERKKFEHVF